MSALSSIIARCRRNVSCLYWGLNNVQSSIGHSDTKKRRNHRKTDRMPRELKEQD